MKKQINPTIKAHLIRGAFYLLLLVAVCAIPFALAQETSSSTQADATQAQAAPAKVQVTKAPPTKAQIDAASGKVFQSGAPGSLTGERSEKPRHRAKRRTDVAPIRLRRRVPIEHQCRSCQTLKNIHSLDHY